MIGQFRTRLVGLLIRPLPLVGALLLAVAALLGGMMLGSSELPSPFREGHPDPDDAALLEEDFAVFWQAWSTLQDNFYAGPLDSRELMRGAVDGMVGAADDAHTYFLPPERAGSHRDWINGTFSGIGVSMSLEPDGAVRIQRVIPGTPAHRAGLLAGDQILSVDDRLLSDLPLAEGLYLIRGESGTVVVLDIYRPATDESLRFEIERSRISPPTVWTRQVDGFGFVELTQFRSRTAGELQDALAELSDAGVEGVVLDLRGNGGGFLSSALGVASQFLPEGVTVAYQTQRTGPNVRHRTGSDGASLQVPLVVLVDSDTASAAEIVAAALADNSRAPLVGQQTYGKGSVQLSFDLSDDSLIRVTVGKWLTAGGTPIDGAGLEPDVMVGSSSARDPNDDDLALAEALRLMRADAGCCLIRDAAA